MTSDGDTVGGLSEGVVGKDVGVTVTEGVVKGMEVLGGAVDGGMVSSVLVVGGAVGVVGEGSGEVNVCGVVGGCVVGGGGSVTTSIITPTNLQKLYVYWQLCKKVLYSELSYFQPALSRICIQHNSQQTLTIQHSDCSKGAKEDLPIQTNCTCPHLHPIDHAHTQTRYGELVAEEK